jgi:hypothetical protein
VNITNIPHMTTNCVAKRTSPFQQVTFEGLDIGNSVPAKIFATVTFCSSSKQLKQALFVGLIVRRITLSVYCSFNSIVSI